MKPRITIRLEPCKRSLWTLFAKYHYFDDKSLNKSSRTFLAVASVKGEEDFAIGFCACLPFPTGTMKNVWRAHKTVVSLPEDDPREKELWRMVSDAQAALHLAEGKRYISMAPIRYAIYRDDPMSGWMPTTSNKKRKLKGYCSHEYIGDDEARVQQVAKLILAGYQGIHNKPTEDGFLNWRGKRILRVRVTSIINGKDAHDRREQFWYGLSNLIWSAGWEGNNIIARGCREAYIFRQYDATNPKRPKTMPEDWAPITDMSNHGGHGAWGEAEYARGLVALPPWRPDYRVTMKERMAGVTPHDKMKAKKLEWCGEPIKADDISGRTFQHELGSLYVHKLWDMATYDGSCVWLCENLNTGLAELWRTCDLTRISRRGQRVNKLAYGGYRLYAEGAGLSVKGTEWAEFRTKQDDAQKWLDDFHRQAVGHNPRATGVFRVSNEEYNASPIPKQHHRGANFGGARECWAYKKDGISLGFAAMSTGKSNTLARVVVENTLPREECIAVGRALVQAMCEHYPVWASTTDSDSEKEAPFYHYYYKVPGVQCVKETTKAVPKELEGIPLHVEDWASKEKCIAFLAGNPQWHERLVAWPYEKRRVLQIRPGGKDASEAEMRAKLQKVDYAGARLRLVCPATQIRYRYEK